MCTDLEAQTYTKGWKYAYDNLHLGQLAALFLSPFVAILPTVFSFPLAITLAIKGKIGKSLPKRIALAVLGSRPDKYVEVLCRYCISDHIKPYYFPATLFVALFIPIAFTLGIAVGLNIGYS